MPESSNIFIRTTIFIVLIILLNTPARAQLTPRSSIVKIDYGYLIGKSKESDNSTQGSSYSASFEKIASNESYGFGFFVGYFNVNDEITQSNGSVSKIKYTSFPIYFNFSYYFTTSKLVPYTGFGVGLHFSSGEGLFNLYQSDRGMIVVLPVGIKWFFIPDLALDLSYRLNYLGSSYLDDGIASTFNIGIAYNFW